jgi:hypothetical protein
MERIIHSDLGDITELVNSMRLLNLNLTKEIDELLDEFYRIKEVLNDKTIQRIREINEQVEENNTVIKKINRLFEVWGKGTKDKITL